MEDTTQAPLSPDRLAAIRERLHALGILPEGPWERWEGHGAVHIGPLNENTPGLVRGGKGSLLTVDAGLLDVEDQECAEEAAAEFCAHARQDVPDLLAEVERLRRENAELEGEKIALREQARVASANNAALVESARRATEACRPLNDANARAVVRILSEQVWRAPQPGAAVLGALAAQRIARAVGAAQVENALAHLQGTFGRSSGDGTHLGHALLSLEVGLQALRPLPGPAKEDWRPLPDVEGADVLWCGDVPVRLRLEAEAGLALNPSGLPDSLSSIGAKLPEGAQLVAEDEWLVAPLVPSTFHPQPYTLEE